jgi:pimeloyl-ACP methyl ester carboxylesterase
MRRTVLAISISIASVSAIANASIAPASPPAIRFEPYLIVSPWGIASVRAQLGRLRVPESRAGGPTREIEIAFVRIPTVAARPGAPIVWLAGGPGWPGTADLDTPMLRLFLELRGQGDVLVLDQRGTGLYVPRLDCEGSIVFPRDLPLDRARSLDGLESAARACSGLWRARGFDLAAYNTRESAEDLEDLRRALGVEKLRLLAGSYGTHLALAAIRAHEDRIDRAVLAGVVGPDHLRRVPADTEARLAEIGRLARRDPVLSERVPDLVEAIRAIRDRLTARPETVSIDALGGGRVEVVVGKFDFAWYMRSLLSSRDSIAHVPALVAAMSSGDFSELARSAAAWRTTPAPPATMFTMRCASGASAERVARISKERESATLADATDFAEERVCRAWGVAPLSSEFREPVRSRVPTLFVSGTLDGDTPEGNASEVRQGFANGEQLLVDGAAHALLGLDDGRTRDAVARFFAGSAIRSARVSLPALAFERPAAIGPGSMVAGGRDVLSPFLFGGGSP